VAWATPQFTTDQVDEAGKFLVAPQLTSSEGFESQGEEALEIINNWRSSHGYPLHCMTMTLRNRVKQIDSKAIIAQRIKRLYSIESKLRRFKHIVLSKMDDIGGCRAVVRNVSLVKRLVAIYEESHAKNPKKRAEFVKKNDYVSCPKFDGYRSVHFVYRHRSESERSNVYNGLKIEIQIRSRAQHAWATASETVSTFTGQALKSNLGHDSWKRFFVLMGSALALREGTALVENTPTTGAELKKELIELERRLKVRKLLTGWTESLNVLPTKNATDAYAFLLELDTNKFTIRPLAYKEREMPKAYKDYLIVERDIEQGKKRGVQAVLVSVSSLQALRSAYPNYYVDTHAFVRELDLAVA
jgi:hypothetical protein